MRAVGSRLLPMAGMVRAAVVTLVLLTLGASALIYRDIQGWVGRTYPGFLLFPTGAIASQSAAADLGFLEQYGLLQRDWILAVDGVPTPTAAAVYAELARRTSGEPVRYEVRRPRGERFEVTIPARAFSSTIIPRFVVPLIVGGLLALAAGALGVLVRPDLGAARVLFLFCWSGAATFFLDVPDLLTTARFVPFSYLTSALFKASLLHLAFTFPLARGPFRTRARTPLLAAMYAVLLAQSTAYGLAIGRAPEWIEVFDTLTYLVAGLGVTLFAANVIATAWRAPSERLRQQARVALVGPAFSLVLVTALSIAAWITPVVRAPTLVVTLINAVFAITLTYAMLRHNLFEFDTVLRRGLAAAGVLIGGALVYVGLFVLLGRLLGEPAAWVAVALGLGAVAVGVPGFRPLGRRVEQAVAQLLFPGMRAAAEAVAEAGARLVPLRDPAEVAQCLRDLAVSGFHARDVRVLRTAADGSVVDLLDASFCNATPELHALCRASAAVDLDAGEERTPHAVRELLEKLAARVLLPLPADPSEPGGALACGPRSDGRLYTREDVEQLESLAAQASVALANAAAWDRVRALQERLAEENALLRAEFSLEHGFDEIVGSAPGLRGALAQVEQVAPTDATVLVVGETGTGKELIVRALHRLSPRAERPLVKVDVRRRSRRRSSRASSSATSAAPSRAPTASSPAASRPPTAARSSSTRSASCRSPCRRSSCARSRRARSSASAAARCGRSTCASSPRRTAISSSGCARAASARTSTTGCTSFRSSSRRSASAARTSGRSPSTSSRPSAGSSAASRSSSRRPRSPRSRPTIGPATCASSRNVIERAVVLRRGGEVELPEPLEAPAFAPGGAAPGAHGSLADEVREFKIRAIGDALAASDGNQRIAAEALGMHRQSLTRMIRELGMRSET